MKTSRRIIDGSVLAVFCMLLFLAAAPKEAYGADAVDAAKDDCTMTFSLSDDFGELGSQSIPVAVYRVASVNTNGAYNTTNA